MKKKTCINCYYYREPYWPFKIGRCYWAVAWNSAPPDGYATGKKNTCEYLSLAKKG